MAITGITVTVSNGISQITNAQTITGTGTADGECLHLTAAASFLEVTGTGSVVVTNGQVFLDADVGTGNDATSPINYGGRTVTTSEMAFRHCILLCGPFTARRNIQVTELSNCEVIEADDTGFMFVYTGTDAIIDTVRFKGINTWEIYQPPSVFFNTVVEDCNYGYLNWEGGRVDVFGFRVINAGIAEIWIGAGNSGNNQSYHWNNHSSFDNTNVRHENANNEYFSGYTASWKFVDILNSNAPTQDVKLLFRESRDGGGQSLLATYITNSSGILVGTYDSQNRTTGGSIARPTLFMQVAYSDTGGSTYQGGGLDQTYDLLSVVPAIEVRSYGHLAPTGFEEANTFVPTEEIGSIASDLSVNLYANFGLLTDTGLTATYATANAYTTLINLEQLFDRTKAEWYDNNNYPLGIRDGIIINFGANRITVDGTAVSAFAFSSGSPDTITIKSSTLAITSKFKTIETTQDVTLTNGAILGDGIVIQGDLILTEAIDLTGVTINGDLIITAAGTYNFANVTVTGDVTNTDGAGNVLINLTNQSSITTSEPGSGNGQVQLVNTVPIKVIVKDIDDGTLLENARVLIKAVAGGDLPASASITSITRSGSIATVTQTAHGMATGETIYISGANQSEYNSHHQVTVTGVNTYTYTVAGTPTTPATGTIIGTAIIVNELTDVDGEINETHRYTSDQPVDGWVRKATL